MSWVSDSTELVSGGWLASGYAGHGILGSAIPAAGDNGGSPVLNDGVAPASEYRWELVTPPGSGSLTLFEDLTFEYDNPADGLYSFVYRLYEDGASAGTATVGLQIGPSHVAITATTAGATGQFGSHSTATSVVSAVTGAVTASFVSGAPSTCSINAVTGGVAAGVASSAGVCATAILAATAQVTASISSVGHVPTGGVALSPADIAAIAAAVAPAVLAALNAATIPVNVKQVNSVPIKGSGVIGDTWGPV